MRYGVYLPIVIPPETYAEIATDLQAARTTDTPYDVVVIGNADATEPTPATIPQYEQAGVTWILTQALTRGRRPGANQQRTA